MRASQRGIKRRAIEHRAVRDRLWSPCGDPDEIDRLRWLVDTLRRHRRRSAAQGAR